MNVFWKSYSSLPPLSWAAEIQKDCTTIHHGPQLEHGVDWLVDGAWPGRFEAGLPNEPVEGFFAFSLRIRGGDIEVECPTHPLERLFLLRERDRLFVSPSSAFLLALSGASLDPAYPDYLFDMMRAISSIAENCGATPLAAGKTLQIVANRRIIISNNLETRIEYRPMEKSFRSFSEYRDFLVSITAGLYENISSRARKSGRYEFISTISNGYDSPMLNVLAKPFGLKDAVTFSAPGDQEDGGEHIGRYLGVKVHSVDRHAFRQMNGCPEAEFIAAGARGEDVVFADAENLFANKAVITGIFAEVADRNMIHTSADIRRTNSVGCGLLEFRWRTPFFHTPIGHAGCMGMMSLKAISHSREMEPWSVGGNYDRPIARRIIEEAGVPRGEFARHKIGLISVSFNEPDRDLERFMNPHSYESLTRFAHEHQRKRSRLADLRRLGKYSAYRVERFVGHTLQRAGLFDKVPNSFELQHHRRLHKASFLLPWAVEQIKERYTRGLSGGSS